MILLSELRPGILTELGFGSLSDPEDTKTMDTAMVELYRLCHSAAPQRKFPATDRTFGANWINLNDPNATELAFACVALDDPSALRDPRRLVKRELEARDWNAALGIEAPTIVCKIRIHGNNWGIRFQSAGAPRGHELRNGELPPQVPSVGAGGEADGTPPVGSSSSDPSPRAETEPDILMEYLV